MGEGSKLPLWLESTIYLDALWCWQGLRMSLLVENTTPRLSSRTAQPIRDLVPQSPLRSPLFADAPAGMTSFGNEEHLEALWCPFWSPNRFEYRDRAICRVKSRFPSEICRVAARSGLDPSNCPQTIEFGLWCWQGLHQSLPDENTTPNHVIPDGEAESQTLCRKVL